MTFFLIESGFWSNGGDQVHKKIKIKMNFFSVKGNLT